MLSLGLGLGGAAFARKNTPFNPARMKYNGSKSLSIAAQETGPSGLAFNTAGTRMMISGTVGDDIYPYDSITWADLSTGAYNVTDKDDLANNPTGLRYNSDGTRMFVYQSSTAIEGYNSTAFIPVSNTYVAGYRLATTGTGITYGRAICFSDDGLILVTAGDGSNKIHYYDCTSAFDPNPATRNAAKEYDVTAVMGASRSIADIHFLDSGKVMQVLDQTGAKLYTFNLSTAYNPATAVHDAAKLLDLSGVDTAPVSFEWDPTGTYLYVAGAQHDRVHFFGPSIDLSQNLGVIFLGDSLINDMRTTPGDATIEAVLDNSYKYVDIYGMALGGTALYTADGSGALVNSTTMALSSTYMTWTANILLPEIVQAVVLSIGTNGWSATGSDPTTYFQAFNLVLNDLKNRLPNLQKIIVHGWNRHTGVTDAGWQLARDTKMLELTHDPLIIRGPELYDLNSIDAQKIHPSSAGYSTLGTRLSNRILGVLGKMSAVGTVGPQVTSVTYSGTTVTAQITHDGGTSLTGTEFANFRIEDDGVAATITGVVVNANNLVFTVSSTIAPGSVVKFWPVWGKGSWTEANIIRDNNGLPIITTAPLIASEA
jgi:hypothetical protein